MLVSVSSTCLDLVAKLDHERRELRRELSLEREVSAALSPSADSHALLGRDDRTEVLDRIEMARKRYEANRPVSRDGGPQDTPTVRLRPRRTP
jgi:hypothetical protein